jgi:hypothetical protein
MNARIVPIDLVEVIARPLASPAETYSLSIYLDYLGNDTKRSVFRVWRSSTQA